MQLEKVTNSLLQEVLDLYLYSSSVIFGNIGGNILNQDIIFDIMLIVCGLGYLTYVILTV